jgi:hypothetical protein
MRARILEEPPVSGSIPEVAFTTHGPPVTWVEFEPDGGERWAGVFPCGEGDHAERVVPFPTDPDAAFVSARGIVFVVDVATRTLRYDAGSSLAHDVIAVPGQDLLLACDSRYVTAYASRGKGPLWRRYVALDGMTLAGATAGTLTGYVEEDVTENESPVTVWRAFTLHLADRRVDYGEVVPEKVARAGRAG